MENYKIKRNPKPLTDDQINRHKDFGNLMETHKKLYQYKNATRPLYKNYGFMSLMVLIGVVLLVLIIDHRESSSVDVPKKDTIKAVKADTGLQTITNLDQPDNSISTPTAKKADQTTVSTTVVNKAQTTVYEVFKIDPQKGAVLYTAAGLRLLVPSSAFTGKANKVVEKEVTLQYREILSLKEAGLTNDNSFIPSKSFELIAMESASKKSVVLTKPIVMELVTYTNDGKGMLYSYVTDTKKWEASGEEKSAYRFLMQANEMQFPELLPLKGLAWELPAESGKPTDFNYIFNRPWRSFSFKTSDKKELAVKNTNTSYKGMPDIITMLNNSDEDKKLRNAVYQLYNNSKSGKPADEISTQLVEGWRNSPEGNAYQTWIKNAGANQFMSNYKTSKLTIKTLGFHSFSYKAGTTATLANPSKRVLTMEKYPEKTQQNITDPGQN